VRLRKKDVTFDVELKKTSKNGLLRDAYLASKKSNAHFMRVYRIISHQRYVKAVRKPKGEGIAFALPSLRLSRRNGNSVSKFS